MTERQRETLILQAVPPPWARRRRRIRRGPDGRLLTDADRRWMQELKQLQAAELQAAQQSSPPA